MPERDDRSFYALAVLLAVIILAFASPGSRGWLAESVIGPLRSQADPGEGHRTGYTIESLLVWAAVGGVLAWAAYEFVFVRARFRPDHSFFLALAPALLLGPVLHAALVARLLPSGSVIAYLAAEPLVYLAIAGFAAAGLWLGRLGKRPVLVPLLWGGLGLAPVLWLLLPRLDAESARLALLLLGLAMVPAAALAFAFVKWKPENAMAPAFAVIAAHALDGATTWMVLRDPFGLGFEGFGERNPVSLTLVNLANGWPYFALKLALPIALLSMVKGDGREADLRAFLLFAVFVLGFGPGMANLLQVVFG